jgi:8-amino-7-oxononanoate synthase
MNLAVILGNSTVRTTLMNFARSIIYTTAPSFINIAAIRAAYNLLKTGATQEVSFYTTRVQLELS